MTSRMRMGVLGIVTAAMVAAGVAGPAFAGENDVKFRQATMKAVGGHMGAIAAIVKGEVKHDMHLKAHAAAMANLGRMAPDVFQKGSEGGSALPAIWKKSDDFKKVLAAFETASASLNKAAQGGDKKAIGEALAALGKACNDCHDNFRKKDK